MLSSVTLVTIISTAKRECWVSNADVNFSILVFLAGAQPKPVFFHKGSFQEALKLKCDYLAKQNK